MIDKLYGFRFWLASIIVGFDIDTEVEEAYEAGLNYGRAQRYLEGK
jgi:hypothetical protein